MHKVFVSVLTALGVAVVLTETASAQILSATVRGGVHVPTSNAVHMSGGPRGEFVDREGSLALGASAELNVPLSAFDLRVSADYITGSSISRAGVTEGSPDPDQARTLLVVGDLVVRPLPPFAPVQPYALLGAGYRHVGVDASRAELAEATGSGLAGHVGAGLNVGRRGLGVVVELSDYLSRADQDSAAAIRHTVLLTAGLHIWLF